MELRKLHPTGILSSPGTGIQELMRNFLIRTNFVPGIRHVIGWRGLKDSSSDVDAWTAKIKGSSGVFGIYFEKSDVVGEWTGGRFGLNYFPHPEEEMVELFSLRAGVYTQKDDYLSHARDFLLYPELCELFHIGIIELCMHQSEGALILGLESITQRRVIAKDGISLPANGRTIELVAPGGYDQNFPSYDTALAFYHVLAASLTFNLETPPVYLTYMSRPGTEVVYDSSGNYWKHPSDDAESIYLYLGYGKADFPEHIKRRCNQVESVHKTQVWQTGDEIPPDYENAVWWNAHKISEYQTLDKQILGIDNRPQLILLTGFLGSGKTSFLQHFIEYQVQRSRFVAIIQNEIGEIGLDGKLLDHDFSVTEIDEGCVCCSLIGRLKNAIQQILSEFYPDFIVVETTGLADPYNVLDEIHEVEDIVKFDSLTTIIDGVNIEKSLHDYEIVTAQIKAADILLLNKKDLITDKQIRIIDQKLRDINPTAPIIATQHGDINPAFLYDVDAQYIEGMTHQKKDEGKARQIHHSYQRYGLSSFKVSFQRPMDREFFIHAIRSLPPTIFRIKGVVDIVDTRKPLLFQFVGGRFEFSEFHNLNLPDRFLIFIGKDLQKESIASVFNNHLSSKS